MGLRRLISRHELLIIALIIVTCEVLLLENLKFGKDIYLRKSYTTFLVMLTFSVGIILHSLRPLICRPYPALVNIIALCLILLIGYSQPRIVIPDIGIILIALVLTCSVMSIFLEPGTFWRSLKERRELFIFAIIAVLLPIIYHTNIKSLWHSDLARITTGAVRLLLETVGYEMLPTRPHLLHHALLKLRIGSPCSGLEGIMFLTAILSLLMMLDYKKFGAMRVLIVYAIAVVYMWLLNVLRIMLIFMAGVRAAERGEQEEAQRMVIDLFHHNTGWLLYGVGILIYLMLLLKIADRLQRSPSSS